MSSKIIHGDCLERMKEMREHSVDSIVTDPPYGLSFMGKKWDYDVPSTEIWQEAFRLLKPGGHLLAFFGTRTYHRGVVRIEDAGFEIRDQIGWVYGSGFPKSHNIGKAFDKLQGNEREIVGKKNGTYADIRRDPETGQDGLHGGKAAKDRDRVEIFETIVFSAWEGWGTALKPAWEPIVVARKPLIGTVAENVLEWGTGGLNIDGCRVGYPEGDDALKKGLARTAQPRADIRGGNFHTGEWKEKRHIVKSGMTATGRFPANLIHDGSNEVLALFPESKGQQGDVRGTEPSHTGDENTTCYGEYGRVPATKRGDTGSAARFFYCAKASKSDRGEGNNHPTVKPVELMRYLCRLVTPPRGTVLDPFCGSGSTGKAAGMEGFNFIGIELDSQHCMMSMERINSVNPLFQKVA